MSFKVNGEQVEAGGPEDRLLPWGRVRDMTGISRTTAWRMQQSGTFPEPVQVSPGRVGWWESELTAWKSARSVGGAKTLRPAATPRLPGMARRAPVREAAVPLKPQPETRSFLTPAPSERPSGLATVKPVRKRAGRAVSIDQIDFGF
ncbi:helix-turn-helix transcriptional regulator [Brevundimonas sp.]|uniref:helix-turn-helix transcriptional regulator n=1 Tax=Brevundimonas TaxID=41275 RepID=UPI0028974D96|nr:AlpA family phage regulatory protein [Brevundimonas sp.]